MGLGLFEGLLLAPTAMGSAELPADLLALRTSTLYVKPSPASCLSTEPVRVRRSAQIGYKLLRELDGFFSCNKAASGALCCRGGGVDCEAKWEPSSRDIASDMHISYLQHV